MKSTHICEGVYKTTTMKIPPSTNKDQKNIKNFLNSQEQDLWVDFYQCF